MPQTNNRKVTEVIKALLRILLACLILYLLYVGLIYVVQDDMVFPGTQIEAPMWSAPESVELWTEPIESGHVEAFFAPAPNASTDQPAPLLVFFHGNGGLIDDSLPRIELYHRLGFAVLAPEYRGYGRSDGEPSQPGIVEDSLRFIERAANRDDVDEDRVLYQGQSLGGAVAVAVALRRAPEAMILESTFTSVRAFSRQYYAPGFLAKHPFETDETIGTFDGPILLMHATDDPVVPYAMGERLAELGQDVQFETFTGISHVLPSADDQDQYWSLVDEFSRRTVR